MDDAADLLRAYLAAGDGGDYQRMAGMVAPDAVCYAPGGGLLRGVDAWASAWVAAHEGLDELAHTVVSVTGTTDQAAARVRVTGIHTGAFLGVPPTERHLAVDQALFMTVASGRITQMWEIVDTGAGLRQLGVLSDGQALSPGAVDERG